MPLSSWLLCVPHTREFNKLTILFVKQVFTFFYLLVRLFRLIRCHLVLAWGGRNRAHYSFFQIKSYKSFWSFFHLVTSVKVLLSAKVILCWDYAEKHSVTSLKSVTDWYNSFGIFFLLFSILFLLYANKVFAVLITDTHWASVFIELSIPMHRSGFGFVLPELVAVHCNPSSELFKLIPFVCVGLRLLACNFICSWCCITSSSHT